MAVYRGVEELDIAKTPAEHELSEDSRFVRFFYTEKAQGNVGIYDIYIGVPGEPEPAVTVTGETTVRLGGTFELALALENYAGGEYTWTNDVSFGSIDADTATFWWIPPRTGEFPVTFSAMDGERTIASTDVTLTVAGEPALVFDGDDEGTVGTPVSFTVVAEYVADPAVTFMGFLDVPEGSALTDEDVTLDFPNVTFTPDVAGDYGLAFSAGTAEGGDYVEDLWIVTVAAAPAEPEVTLVDGETTVELGLYIVQSPIWYECDSAKAKEAQIIKDRCKREGIPFINFTNHPKFMFTDSLFADGKHMNANGAAEFTKELAKIIKKREREIGHIQEE